MSKFLYFHSRNKVTNQVYASLLAKFENNENLFKYKNNNKAFISLPISFEKEIESLQVSAQHRNLYVNFSGFITNQKDLLKKYRISKHITYAEIIVILYRKFGTKFAKIIEGHYSIVIIDNLNDKVLAITDHLASKPIYFYHNNDDLIISSCIKKIASLDFYKKDINWDRIRYHMSTLTGPLDQTFFKNIKKVQPGNINIFKAGKMSSWEYFDFDPNKKFNGSLDDAIEEFKHLFKKSVNVLAPDNINIGAALSGGVDSSSIVSTAKLLNKEIYPQTIVQNGLTQQESKKAYEKNYANEVIKKYSLKSNFIEIEDIGPLSFIDELQSKIDEPVSGMNTYIHSLIFKEMNLNNLSIFLDGYDGDTVVSHGYEKLYKLGTRFQISKLYKELEDIYLARGYNNFDRRSAFIKYVIKPYIPHSLMWRYKSISSNKTPLQNRSLLLNHDILKPLNYDEVKSHSKLIFSGIKDSHKMHYYDIKSSAITTALQKMNVIANSYNIDIRFPFFNKELMEFCLSLPPDYKLKKGVTRHVLKESMKNIIPKNIYNRHTKGHLGILSINQIKNMDTDELFLKIQDYNFLNIEFIKKEIFNNRDKYILEIWMIITLQKWLDNYNNY